MRHLVGSLIVASAASVALVFFGVEPIDLEAVVPWGPDVIYYTPTYDNAGTGQAIAILFSLPVIAAVPLMFRGTWRWRLSVVASVLMSVFVLVSILRVGLLYVPSAWMLALASRIKPNSN